MNFQCRIVFENNLLIFTELHIVNDLKITEPFEVAENKIHLD